MVAAVAVMGHGSHVGRVDLSHAPRAAARTSLSGLLLRLTFGVVLLVQILVFAPAITHERREWLQDRLVHGQIAAMSLGDFRPLSGNPPDQDLAERADLLRLAGAESVRLLPAGGQPIELNTRGPVGVSRVIDLRNEGRLAALLATASSIADGTDRLVAVEAAGPLRPDMFVSVVFHARDLSLYLRTVAQEVALQGLAVAAITGLVVFLALRVLLVRPMRRLIDSITAFRADPERASPLVADPLQFSGDGEVAVAGRELAEMQRELRGALWRYARLAALGTAVAKVSHDLRGILAPALLGAERLQGHADPGVRRIGDQLVRAVERATELVRSGLEFAREGPVSIARRRFPLAAVVAEAAEQARAASAGLTVDNKVDPSLEVDADPEHILRVFGNLLRNAAEAGALVVVVDVTAAGPRQTVITVTDNGPGLVDRVRTNIFKPFVVGARKGSTGLGLAIARDLMRAHLGDIILIRSGPDGTVFQLTLPPALSSRPVLRQSAAAQ